MRVEYNKIPRVCSKYMAGSDGNVYSFYSGKPKKLAPSLSSSGKYNMVSVVFEDGKRRSRDVHSLVCAAFHEDRPTNKHCVAHNDGDSLNNIPSNLRWTTPRKNLDDRFLHGTHDSGTSNTRASLDKDSLFVVRWLLSSSSLSHEVISDIVGVSRATVSKISNGSRYKNIEVSVVEGVAGDKIEEVLDGRFKEN